MYCLVLVIVKYYQNKNNADYDIHEYDCIYIADCYIVTIDKLYHQFDI